MRDLEGSLELFEPISVLQMLNLARVTGELKLDIEGNSASIFFNQGNLKYASVATRSMRLGETLLKGKYISERELEQMLKDKEQGKKLGELLIEAGIIGEEDLREALQEQVKEVIYEIVRWRVGRFRFSSGVTPTPQEILIDIPLDHLMLEGLKRMDEERGQSR